MSAMLAYMSVPDAYGVVEPGVYRAKAAAAPNLPFLLHLRLRTLLYLSPDPLLPSVHAFLDKCATRFIHLGFRVWKPYATWKPVSEELIKDALEIVLDVNTHPIMVMCSLVWNPSDWHSGWMSAATAKVEFNLSSRGVSSLRWKQGTVC